MCCLYCFLLWNTILLFCSFKSPEDPDLEQNCVNCLVMCELGNEIKIVGIVSMINVLVVPRNS